MKRRLELTAARLLAYSRSGNFHSDPGAAARLGYEKLVAAGMQVAGPAYGLLLDRFGDEFLERGEIEMKFVGMAVDGDEIEGVLEDDDTFAVTVVGADHPAVVGSGRLTPSPGAP